MNFYYDFQISSLFQQFLSKQETKPRSKSTQKKNIFLNYLYNWYIKNKKFGTRTKLFSQPGLVGATSSWWTISPAKTKDTLNRNTYATILLYITPNETILRIKKILEWKTEEELKKANKVFLYLFGEKIKEDSEKVRRRKWRWREKKRAESINVINLVS